MPNNNPLESFNGIIKTHIPSAVPMAVCIRRIGQLLDSMDFSSLNLKTVQVRGSCSRWEVVVGGGGKMDSMGTREERRRKGTVLCCVFECPPEPNFIQPKLQAPSSSI